MGQDEIAKLLKEKYPEYLTATSIMELTGVNRSSVNFGLRKLSKRNEIQFIIKQGSDKRSGWKKYYRIKEEQ